MSIVCWNYLSVLVAVVVVANFFSKFDCFCASRAFSIWTWRARISSALSILNSSSVGSTYIVTDVVRAFSLPICYYTNVISTGTLLDDGVA